MIAGALLGTAGELRERDERHVQFFGDRFQASRDLRNLLVPRLDLSFDGHQLEVVDHDHVEAGLHLQPPRFGAHLHDVDAGRVIDEDLRLGQARGGVGEVAPVPLAEHARPDEVIGDAGLRRKDAEADLLLRHFQREDADRVQPLRRRPRIAGAIGDGDRFGHVHHKGRLPHRRPCGNNYQILRLEPRGEFVESVVAGGDAGDQLSGVLQLLDGGHVRTRDAIERDEAFLDRPLGDFIDRFLGDVEHVRRLAGRIERGAHDGVAHHDQPPQRRLLLDDVRVPFDVGDVRNAVDERRDVRRSADLLELRVL